MAIDPKGIPDPSGNEQDGVVDLLRNERTGTGTGQGGASLAAREA